MPASDRDFQLMGQPPLPHQPKPAKQPGNSWVCVHDAHMGVWSSGYPKPSSSNDLRKTNPAKPHLFAPPKLQSYSAVWATQCWASPQLLAIMCPAVILDQPLMVHSYHWSAALHPVVLQPLVNHQPGSTSIPDRSQQAAPQWPRHRHWWRHWWLCHPSWDPPTPRWYGDPRGIACCTLPVRPFGSGKRWNGRSVGKLLSDENFSWTLSLIQGVRDLKSVQDPRAEKAHWSKCEAGEFCTHCLPWCGGNNHASKNWEETQHKMAAHLYWQPICTYHYMHLL